MTSSKQQRIFWLGMHKVLTATELPRLRQLGYEVFNPPYLSSIYDQSAQAVWEHDQFTTLPREDFEELSRYNFFYNSITPRIAELLNEYFGTLVLTISPHWLKSMLEGFHGRVLYRVYGQPGTLCDTLRNLRMFRTIQERDDFHFMPHSAEAVRDEHSWIKSRMTVVPYTLPLDVFEHENTWSPDEPHATEIMACCPNIENPYYNGHYTYLNSTFPESYLKLYGVQPRDFGDPRLAGTLPRNEHLQRYRRAAGYWFHYTEPYTCYLPPIEMMTIGGPTLYMKGSLLAHYFATPGPGEATSVDEAKRKMQLLMVGDRSFVEDVREAQRPVARRYHPDHVNPIFDREFKRLLGAPPAPKREPAVLRIGEPCPSRGRAYILFHKPGQHVAFHGGKYHEIDDLARTVRQAVSTLLDETSHEVVVTCFAHQLENNYGYLNADTAGRRLKFMVLDADQIDPQSVPAVTAPARELDQPAANNVAAPTDSRLPQPTVTNSRKRPSWSPQQLLSFLARHRALFTTVLYLGRAALASLRLARRVKRWGGDHKRRLKAAIKQFWYAPAHDPWISRYDCMRRINEDQHDTVVVVPNVQYAEALLLERPLIVCRLDDEAIFRHAAGGLRGRLLSTIDNTMQSKVQASVPISQLADTAPFASKSRAPLAGPHAPDCQLASCQCSPQSAERETRKAHAWQSRLE